MVKIQLDITKNQSKFLSSWSIEHDLKDKRKALLDILNEFIINFEKGNIKMHNPDSKSSMTVTKNKTFLQFKKESSFHAELITGTTQVRICRVGGSCRIVDGVNNFSDFDPICREIAKRDYHKQHKEQ